MMRRVNLLSFTLALALVTSGLLALFLSPVTSTNGPLQNHATTASAPSSAVGFGVVTLSASGGTMILLQDTAFNPLPTTIVVVIGTVVADGRSELKTKKLRDRILDEISQNPGIHLRELHRVLGCAMGALQYHLNNLQNDGHIISFQMGNTRHFFIAGFSEDEQVLRLASLVRNPTIESILHECLHHDRVTQAELSRSLSLEKSLISYYANNLVQSNVLKTIKVFGRERPLALTDWARNVIHDLNLL